jgi:DNA-binding transcriptional LysR family regulator
MYPGIDLRLQRFAVVLAEVLSFSKAAAILHVAQPALSRSIRQLEDQVGARLFERTSRRVRVTEAGQRFVAEARRSLYHSDRLFEVVKLGQVPDKLIIGYSAHFDVRHVIQLSKLSVPGVHIQRFRYQSLSTTGILAALKNRTIDCGMIALPNDYPEVLEFTTAELFRHQLAIIVPKGHALARKRNLRLTNLREEPLIFVAKEQDTPLYLWLERRCRTAGFSPQIVQEIYHAHDYAPLVAHGAGIGLGFGFSQKWCAKHLFPNLVLRPFNHPQLAIEVAMLFAEKFNFRPLSGFVAAVQALRGKHAQNDRELRLSA